MSAPAHGHLLPAPAGHALPPPPVHCRQPVVAQLVSLQAVFFDWRAAQVFAPAAPFLHHKDAPQSASLAQLVLQVVPLAQA